MNNVTSYIAEVWNKIRLELVYRPGDFDPAPILYFFPGNEIPAAFKPRFTAHCSRRNHITGPEGEFGMLASPFSGELKYDPENQVWRQSGGVWIGFRSDFHPGMIAKRDSRQLKGYPVTLPDGNEWVIPVAYLQSEICCVPHYFNLDDSGKWLRVPDESFASICMLAERVWNSIGAGGELEDFSDDELITAASLALSANYDISPAEAGARKILDSASVTAIFSALIDEPGCLEILAQAETGRNAARTRWQNGRESGYNPTCADLDPEKKEVNRG